jgi:hypothetical protein
MAKHVKQVTAHASDDCSPPVQVFSAEWDSEGVFFYQAFKAEIADWALEHQRFGGPHFKPTRMTWIKPSLAWALYRFGYARKHHQTRILKVKLSHATVAELLSGCACREGGGGTKGRVQWDPARDLMQGDGREPRKMLHTRAIQIGLSRDLSERYVVAALSIEDVTELAQKVEWAHAAALNVGKAQRKGKRAAGEGAAPAGPSAMEALGPELPRERHYMPRCPPAELMRDADGTAARGDCTHAGANGARQGRGELLALISLKYISDINIHKCS